MAEDQDPNYGSTKRAQEEARQREERLQARKERFDSRQQDSGHKNARIAAWITASATALGAIATIVAALIGANSAKAANQTTNFFGNAYLGYQVIGEAVKGGKLKTEASQQAPVSQTSANPQPPQQSPEQKPPQPSQTPDLDVARISGARCTTSDSAAWGISTDDAKRVQDQSGNYYSIDLRLKNLSQNTLYVTHPNSAGALTDDAQNHAELRPSIGRNQRGEGGVRVAPSSDTLETFTSWPVKTPLGAKLDFASTFLVTAMDNSGRAQSPYTLAASCHNLPVAGASIPVSTTP